MNIVEYYMQQDLRSVNYGIKHGAQPARTVQLCNASSQALKLLLTNKNDSEWRKRDGPGVLHLSGDGLIFNERKTPYVALNPTEWIILDLPTSAEAFVIYPRSLCDGDNCLAGATPSSQTGFYKQSGDWQNPWPNGGGYTICDLAHGCNNNFPSVGATKIESGKDMVSDISMVDGFNHSVKMEVSTEINDGDGEVKKRDVTIVANPQDCQYGVRNYAADTSKGMIGCSNTFKDGNQKSQVSAAIWDGPSKPRTRDLTPEGQSGFCNFIKIPWNDCQRPCDPASNPDTPNWQGPCFAPTMGYCKTIHNDNYTGNPPYYGDKTTGKFTTYCFSHDDDNSSPELKDDAIGQGYRLKLTFGDGIVGKPFSNEGCDWSKGACSNPNPPGNTAWYCTPEKKCSLLLQRDHDPGYTTKEDCVRNSDCINYSANFYCANDTCTFDDNDNLQTLNNCMSACGGRPVNCREGCNPSAMPRAVCRSGKYCPANGCCDNVAPVPPPRPPAQRYDCVNGNCIMNFLGSYPTKEQCESGCGSQPCRGNLCDPHADPVQRCPNGILCPVTGCCPP